MPGGSYSTSQGGKLRTCFVLLTHRPELAELVARSRRPGQLPLELEDNQNKSLNASAFPPSFLRRQEPETLWTEVPAFAGTTVAVPALRPAQGGRGYGPLYQKTVNHWKPGDTLNKSLNASAFTLSFLLSQEPKTLWTEVPAFAGTTGRDKHR